MYTQHRGWPPMQGKVQSGNKAGLGTHGGVGGAHAQQRVSTHAETSGMNGNAHASHFANQGYSNVSQNGNMGARGEKPKEARYVHPEEDETGHYQVRIGATIDTSEPFSEGRYRVVKLLGSGTYGKVVECEDHKYNKTHVAIKLVRREPPLYKISAKNEIAILRELDGRYGTLKLLRDFDHDGHVCMSFELLGGHLSDVLKNHGKLGIENVRDVSFQLLQAIAYVHSKNIIHTDLKAENILLMSNSTGALSIKVADFGSALFDDAWHPPLVGTMHYRPPEAVLQAGWSHPLDVWAIACLIIELCTGKHAFELAHDDVHLAMMERLLGPIPSSLLHRGFAKRNQYNANLIASDQTGKVRLQPMRNEGHDMVRKMVPLRNMIDDPTLLTLLGRMLAYEPDERIPACVAMNDKFFDLDDDEDSDIEDSLPATPRIEVAQTPHPQSVRFPGPDLLQQAVAQVHVEMPPGEMEPQYEQYHHMTSQRSQPTPSVTRITLADQAAAGISLTPRMIQRAQQATSRQGPNGSQMMNSGQPKMQRGGATQVGSYGLLVDEYEVHTNFDGRDGDDEIQEAIQGLTETLHLFTASRPRRWPVV